MLLESDPGEADHDDRCSIKPTIPQEMMVKLNALSDEEYSRIKQAVATVMLMSKRRTWVPV
jgi:hypothetical protein